MAESQVETGDKAAPLTPEPHPIVLVLDRLRSAHNVGNILRIAELARLQKVIACGYTAMPPHPKLEKTARGCDKLVACEHSNDAASAIRGLLDEGYFVLAMETVAGAPTIWDVELTFPLAIVLGNEALGIDPDALDLCTGFARLPVYGTKNSMNVGNCAAVAVYEALRRITA